ncbi:hypothetical protein AVEN_237381-1 [Araneus ventricosus]|uniref:C2H2-type domain-containing protein n=1 Tax=Araneus ventricosus TaxID=182803 RepID=A0A4Y2JXW8_ARAVE|nr:hypothetical protein AVEN_237381-1 [Araneus ventricosus]
MEESSKLSSETISSSSSLSEVSSSDSDLMSDLLTNPKEKLHKCEICHGVFKHVNCLKDHMLIHLNEKNHSCEACGKAFSRKGILIPENHPLWFDECKLPLHSKDFPSNLTCLKRYICE